MGSTLECTTLNPATGRDPASGGDPSPLQILVRPNNRPASCHSETTGTIRTVAGHVTIRSRRYDVETPLRGRSLRGRPLTAQVTVFRVAVALNGGAYEEVWTSGPDFPASSHLEAHLMASDRIEAVMASRRESQPALAA